MHAIDFEFIETCPICNSTGQKNALTCEDYLVSGSKFSLVDCNECGFRFTNPRPTEDSIYQYYQSDDYISHNDEGGGVVKSIYKYVRSYTLQTKEALIRKLAGTPKRLLDIGCGTGAFLNECQQEGWNIAGVEIDIDARKASSQKLGISISERIELLPTGSQFDVITMWHVMEHVHKLNKLWEHVNEFISPGGHFVVAVPNADSYDAHYFKQYWAAYDVPRHLYHFTPATMEQLAANHGFKLIEKKAMPFDAFYIALLSTRYASGKTDYLKSMKAGIVSNWKARRTKHTSSIIYVFKRA